MDQALSIAPNPITEDQVKEAVKAWLIERRYRDVVCRLGTRSGADVSARSPESNKELWVECKGETAARNQWDRSWRNLADAFFKAIDLQGKSPADFDIAIAIPDTNTYRTRMGHLETFCRSQNWLVLWVSMSDDGNGVVSQWF